MPAFLIPLCIVAITWLILPRHLLSGPRANKSLIISALIASAMVVIRYLYWRLTKTLPSPNTPFAEEAFVWFLLAFEMLVWINTAILFATLARQRNNSAAADIGERKLRDAAPSSLPMVDVFIATYNEDIDVLEKTIAGAIALDWPKDRINVFILDDGKRDWLQQYCNQRNVGYLTRPDNSHAKAGNINAAIARTSGEYFMVLDADFVPQKNFLYRSLGLFDDPKVGIVQIPHNFYNLDPMQANLQLRNVMPGDQRLFFDKIMPGRDGWDASFCCGSNSITRRTAMEEIGNKLPTGSITEDMLLTLALLRKGYVTRYLNERLAIGLAPESLTAMYVQRARWARGAIQMIFLKDGPLGPGLRMRHRIMFFPAHWILQPIMVLTSLLTPTICLWTGWSPLPTATSVDIFYQQIPALVATIGVLRLVAPGAFYPLANTVHALLQAPRIIPTVITTLIKPHGHAFVVTPKGNAASGFSIDRAMVFTPVFIILMTAFGLYINSDIDTRIVTEPSQIPLLAVWAFASMIVLSIVQVVAVAPSRTAPAERFVLNKATTAKIYNGDELPVTISSMSTETVTIQIHDPSSLPLLDKWVLLDVPGLGQLPCIITRRKVSKITLAFDITNDHRREALITDLFTNGYETSTHLQSSARVAIAMIARIFSSKKDGLPEEVLAASPPKWVQKSMENLQN